MNIYIDQSGKVEQTDKDTVVAYADHKQKTILITGKDKRNIQRIFREADKPNIFVYKTFAVLIYLLIKGDLKQIDEIIIDEEYSGRGYLIKNFLVQIIRDKSGGIIQKEQIYFQRISKHCKAHEKAINTFRGDCQPELTARWRDVLPYIV